MQNSSFGYQRRLGRNTLVGSFKQYGIWEQYFRIRQLEDKIKLV